MKKEKVYHSIKEVEKDFFPVLVEEERKKREEEHPEEAAERIAKEIIEKARRSISK